MDFALFLEELLCVAGREKCYQFPLSEYKKELGTPQKWCTSGQRLIHNFDQAVILWQRSLQCVCTPELSFNYGVLLSPLPPSVLESLKL